MRVSNILQCHIHLDKVHACIDSYAHEIDDLPLLTHQGPC